MTVEELLKCLDMEQTELAVCSDSDSDELAYYDVDSMDYIPYFVLTARVKKFKVRTCMEPGHIVIYVYI